MTEPERLIHLTRWIPDYNCHRHHTAVGGPPASRDNNVSRTDTQGVGSFCRPAATV